MRLSLIHICFENSGQGTGGTKQATPDNHTLDLLIQKTKIVLGFVIGHEQHTLATARITAGQNRQHTFRAATGEGVGVKQKCLHLVRFLVQRVAPSKRSSPHYRAGRSMRIPYLATVSSPARSFLESVLKAKLSYPECHSSGARNYRRLSPPKSHSRGGCVALGHPDFQALHQ